MVSETCGQEKIGITCRLKFPNSRKIFPYCCETCMPSCAMDLWLRLIRCSHHAKKFKNLPVKLMKNSCKNISSVKVGYTSKYNYWALVISSTLSFQWAIQCLFFKFELFITIEMKIILANRIPVKRKIERFDPSPHFLWSRKSNFSVSIWPASLQHHRDQMSMV